MNYLPLSCTSSPCKLLFFNRGVYGLVQATVGVGTVLIWDFCVAYTRGGGYFLRAVVPSEGMWEGCRIVMFVFVSLLFFVTTCVCSCVLWPPGQDHRRLHACMLQWKKLPLGTLRGSICDRVFL